MYTHTYFNMYKQINNTDVVLVVQNIPIKKVNISKFDKKDKMSMTEKNDNYIY